MSAHSLPTLGATAGHPDASDHYFQTILHGLVGMANDMACQIHAQAMAQASVAKAADPDTAPPTPATSPAPQPTPDLTIQFDRIARAIRRTILLSRSIAQPAPARAAPASAPASADLAAARRRAEARLPILRTVERALAQAGPQALAHEGVRALLQARKPARLRTGPADDDSRPEPGNRRDRLDAPDRPDAPDALRNRSDADILTEILLDLGLTAPPARPRRNWRRKAASTGLAADPLAPQPQRHGLRHARQQAPPPSPAPSRDTRPGDG